MGLEQEDGSNGVAHGQTPAPAHVARPGLPLHGAKANARHGPPPAFSGGLSILPVGPGAMQPHLGLGLESPLFLPIVPVEPSPTTGIQHLIPPLFQSNAASAAAAYVKPEPRAPVEPAGDMEAPISAPPPAPAPAQHHYRASSLPKPSEWAFARQTRHAAPCCVRVAAAGRVLCGTVGQLLTAVHCWACFIPLPAPHCQPAPRH